MRTITITQGNSYEFIVHNNAEKTGFINITKPDGSTPSSDSVLFYAFTKNAVDNDNGGVPAKIYDMSAVSSVLLPVSSTDYYIWLGAKQTVDLVIVASGAKYLLAGAFAAIVSLFAVLF